MKLQPPYLKTCQIDLTVSWLSIIIAWDLMETRSACFSHDKLFHNFPSLQVTQYRHQV